jgi:hypothetical protein
LQEHDADHGENHHEMDDNDDGLHKPVQSKCRRPEGRAATPVI